MFAFLISSRAIALSLAEGDAHQSSSKDDPIIISSDDDEPPPSTHAFPQPEASSSQSHAPKRISDSADVPTVAMTTANTFLSERAQLEAARLARLKRMRESNTASGSQKKLKSKRPHDDLFVSSDEDVQQGPTGKKSKLSPTTYSKDYANAASSSKSETTGQLRGQPNASLSRLSRAVDDKQVEAVSASGLFWAGQLRQTANMHVDRTNDQRPVFRLHDIIGNVSLSMLVCSCSLFVSLMGRALQKSELSFIILSSFVTHLSWIYSLIPPSVPVLLIAQPDAKGLASVHNVLPNWVKVTPMLRGGRGCMHMKVCAMDDSLMRGELNRDGGSSCCYFTPRVECGLLLLPLTW
jgi:tyrosyl-DNA phosphodiesterase 1